MNSRLSPFFHPTPAYSFGREGPNLLREPSRERGVTMLEAIGVAAVVVAAGGIIALILKRRQRAS